MCKRELVLGLFDLGFFFFSKIKVMLLAYSLFTGIGSCFFSLSFRHFTRGIKYFDLVRTGGFLQVDDASGASNLHKIVLHLQM